jgi:hypothetical protein
MRPGIWLLAAAGAALGCTPAQEPDAAATMGVPSVAIRRPADGDAVADTVAVRLSVENPEDLARLALVVDGRTASERHRPPWRFIWETAGFADSSWHSLAIAACNAAGACRLSDSCRVLVCANAPPSVEILWPPADRWLDLDRAAHPWRCRAVDPDEGALPATGIEWDLDGVILGTGPELTPPALAAGPHTIRVRATDRWGRRHADSVAVHAFSYPQAADPSAALAAFLCALRAGDAQRAAEGLAVGFLSCPPTGDAASGFVSRAQEVAALQALLAPDRFLSLRIEARATAPETLCFAGRTLAQIDLADLSLLARWRCTEGRGGSRQQDEGTVHEARVTFSGARIGLWRRPDSLGVERWQLWIWRDLHGACWRPGGALSWSALKERGRRHRLCP